MGALQFVFVACLAISHDDCRPVEGPVFGAGTSKSTCMLEGPAITAAWRLRNPDWRVRSWDCRPTSTSDA